MRELTKLNTDDIELILTLADEYKKFKIKTQIDIKIFLGIDPISTTTANKDIAQILAALLNLKETEQIALGTLICIKEKHYNILRILTIDSLSDEELKNIQNIIIKMHSSYKPKEDLNQDRTAFCKELYNAIENLPSETVNNLKLISPLIALIDCHKQQPRHSIAPQCRGKIWN